MKDLVSSNIDRQNILNNSIVFSNLRDCLGVPGMLFQDEFSYELKIIGEKTRNSFD